MKVRFLIIAVILFWGEYLQAQSEYDKVLENILALPEYKNAQVGVAISDVKTSRILYESNGEKLMIPASVLKLVTSAAALEILGSDFRFKTRIGYSGNIENGVLKGDLIILGGGDPALGSEYFHNHYFVPHFMDTWIQSIKAAGIRSVEGRLVTDNSLYGNERIPTTWIWEDMGNYYGTVSSALSIYDNLSRITFQSPAAAGMPTKILSVYPEIKEIQWNNEVLSSDINRDKAYVFGSPVDNQRIIRGTIPRNRNLFTIKASNPFPEHLLTDEFLSRLSSEGIFVTGPVVVGKIIMKEFQMLLSYESPVLSEIVKILNHESVNLFAEHLVKQIAAELTGVGDREAGLKIISEFWSSKGLDVRQLFMEDGSGLSHFNAVSPSFLSACIAVYEKLQPGFFCFL